MSEWAEFVLRLHDHLVVFGFGLFLVAALIFGVIMAIETWKGQ